LCISGYSAAFGNGKIASDLMQYRNKAELCAWSYMSIIPMVLLAKTTLLEYYSNSNLFHVPQYLQGYTSAYILG